MTTTLERGSATDDGMSRGLLGAGLAVTAWASGSVLAKVIGMGGIAIAVYRFWLYGVLLALFMRWRGTPLRWQIIRASSFGGIALGLDVALFFSAIKATTVVNATLIGAMQPVLVGVVAARFFGERIRGRDAGWSLVALVGVIGVVAASNSSDEWSLTGDLLAVGALFAWSAYFIASKQSKASLTPMEFTVGTALWAAAINTPLAFVFDQDLSFPSARDLGLLLAMTATAGILGHSLMNWSLVRIPLWVGSTFTLLIPVASSLLAWLVLDEAVTIVQGAGMALVIFSLAVIVRGQSRPAKGMPT